MKTTNKLVALLLAAVMVLGLMPSMTVHAHAHTHAAELNGIEVYPAITADTPANATIANGGDIAYFTFTPEKTDLYYVYSTADSDTVGYIYDADMNQINYNDDSYYGGTLGVYGPNFCMEQVMEAGTTYVIGAKYYSSYYTGDFTVTAMTGHSYTSEVTKEATCTSDGVMTHTCTYCGDSYEEVIPAAHSYDEKTGVCIYCGEAYLITGVCGENLTWELDYFGNLTIKGTGDMYNYVVSYSENYPAPWYNDYSGAITALVVEEGVTSIGSYALYNCQQMTSVSLPESLTTLGTNAFSSCYGLEEITLPDAITTIPDSCFKYCGSLESIIWPASLTAIESNAFYSCDLSDLVIPEGVTSIGQYAFSSNSSLTKLTLPSTLTDLSDYAFASMYNAKDFVFKGDAPAFGGSQVFQYVTANAWYPLGNESWTDEVKQNYGGTITWKEICSGSHTWNDPVTVPATCETGSYMTMSCSVCGWTEVSPENDDALGHDYQYEHYDGGCGNSSYDIVTCSRCDYYANENWTWNEHSYEVTETVAPTCTTDGYDVLTCSNCGDSYQSNYTYATGHDVTEWSEPSEATCTEDSVKTGTCARCGETATEVVAPALGHEWDMENGTANDDGSVTYPCIRCDATYTTEGTALHLGDNQFTIEANTGSTTKTYTAAQAGKLTITLNNLLYHNTYAYDNGWITDYWQTLAIDWAFSQGFFNVYVNDVNTAYTVEGYETAANIILDDIQVAAGDVVELEIAHTSSSSYDNDPVQFNVNLALEAVHIHTEEIIPAVPATFDAPGLTEGKKCSECGEILVAQEEIPMLDYNEGIVPLNTLIVSCGDYETDGGASEGPAELAVDDDLTTIWHTDWYGTSRDNHWIQFELTEAYEVDGLRYKPRTTGNTNGIITAYDIQVSNDGENFTSVASGSWEGDRSWKVVEFDAENVKYVRLLATDALTDNDYVFACAAEIRLTGEKAEEAPHEHSWSDWTVTTEATCTEKGEETRFCECGEVETREVAALGHDYEAVVTAPTCTEGGYTTYTCSRCGDSYVTDETPALGHTEEIIPGKDATCTETGLTEGKKCSVCGETTVEQEVIPALGHDFVNGECNRCDATLTSKFEDVEAGDFFFDPVEWAVEKGITTGKTDTLFDPEGNCQRATVVTFLWRAAGEPEPTITENPFVDVKESHFFYKAVLWAVENGITNGIDQTHFGPYTDCNRAQVVTFLHRAMKTPAPTTAENPFSDVEEKDFFYDAVLWAVEEGITNGLTDTTFGPDAICNRAQVVTFLYRTYDK